MSGGFVSKKEEVQVETREQVKLQIIRIDESLPLPEYKTYGAAAMDVYASMDDDIESITIGPHDSAKINTGIRVKIPYGYALYLASRSGYAAKYSVTLTNSLGVIDYGFVEELVVMLTNHGKKSLVVNQGDRIAQLILVKVPEITWEEVDQFSDDTFDRQGGFGSTGQ